MKPTLIRASFAFVLALAGVDIASTGPGGRTQLFSDTSAATALQRSAPKA